MLILKITGGDNIFQKKTTFSILDTQDEVLTGYIESQSPVNITLASRIMNANGTVSTQPTGTGSPSTPTESAAPTETPSSGRLSREGVSSVVAISALVLGAVGAGLF